MYQPPPTNMGNEGAQPLMPPQMIGPGQPIQPVAQPFPSAQAMPLNQPMYTQQPIPQIQAQPIVVNQYVPYAPPMKFKTSPVQMICPFCKNNIRTLVDVQFNCLNCCFCFCFCMIWLLVMLIQEKDLNCSNAIHKCPSCGKVLGSYQSC